MEPKDPAQLAYEAYVLSLDGMVPAGLTVIPERLQTWEGLPERVRAAWTDALGAAAPAVIPRAPSVAPSSSSRK